MNGERLIPAPRRRLAPVALAALGLVSLLLVGVPSRSSTRLVGPGENLQAVLDSARPGDVILLQAGATFVGNFVLPSRGAGDSRPITIRSSADDEEVPGPLSRVSPQVAHLMPKLRSPNGEAALRTAPGASHWTIVLVEFLGNAGGAGDIIRLGDGSRAQSDLSQVPHDLVLDRCFVHGDADLPQKRGVALNSGRTRIANSWISDIKARGQDSQAIGGWNGPGPYTIVNNRLEGAGMGFMLGGADPAIPGLVPADVWFKGNHVTRPLAWRDGPWSVKNLLELKNARRVRIEGNLFEHNWVAAQPGFAVLFTPRNQDNTAPWSCVQDVTFRYNVVRHVSGAMNLLGRDSPKVSDITRRIEISNNLFYDVDGSRWGGSGEFLRVGDGVEGLVVEHNTVLQTGNIISVYGGTSGQPMPTLGFVFRSNIVRHNAYGVHGTGQGTGNRAIAAYFPGVVFADNVIAGAPASNYPAGNSYPPADDFERMFADPDQGDFRFVGRPPSAGSGPRVGADIEEILRAWRAAQNGLQFTSRRMEPPSWERETGDDGRRKPSVPIKH